MAHRKGLKGMGLGITRGKRRRGTLIRRGIGGKTRIRRRDVMTIALLVARMIIAMVNKVAGKTLKLKLRQQTFSIEDVVRAIVRASVSRRGRRLRRKARRASQRT